MADIGLDYAGRSPGAAAVKAAGYDFVARYLSRYTAKVITKAEYQDMTSNGVGVVVVFEDYANQALGGYNQGVSDAQFALGQARGIGWPETRPIYFAVDFDISDAQKPIAAQYMRGAISVLGLGRVGAYGGYWWIKYCVENGLASYFWQAVAWSGGNQHPKNNLFQRLGGTTVNGTACDINDARTADYGQSNSQGGGDEVITDSDNEFWRWNKLFTQIRGREASREEFRIYAVGQSWIHALELLSDSTEADQATTDQALGQHARTDGWENQIYGLQAQNADLTKRLSDAQGAEDKTKADLAASEAKNTELQAKIDALNSGDNIIITRKGFAGLFDTIKQYFSKKN